MLSPFVKVMLILLPAISLLGCGAHFSDLPDLPVAETEAASEIGQTRVTLNGSVNPNGGDTDVWFEWGPNETYGNTGERKLLGSGREGIPVGVRLENALTPDTSYHYRVVAKNSVGLVYGADMTFTTPVLQPPTVTTTAPTATSQSGCTFNGAVNPNGSAATGWFEWGVDTNYGTTTAQQVLGDGTLEIAFNQPITDLNLDTIYHYRAVAENEAGTVLGEDRLCATVQDATPPDAPDAPSVLDLGTGNSLQVTWSAANDPESGIGYYIIYRDSVNVETTSTTSFADTGLTAGVTYTYEVSAVNGVDLEGPGSGSVQGVPTVPAILSSSLINGSARVQVGTGSYKVVEGFVIEGDQPKRVLIRGWGPSLADLGLTGVLSNPALTLSVDHDYNPATSAVVIAQNDDWQTTDPLCAAPAVSCGAYEEIIATGLDPCVGNQTGCELESAILVTLPPGLYTATLYGVGNTTGMGMVEVRELDAISRMINLSTRAYVGTGSQVMIGGFIIEGDLPKSVLVQGWGPLLAAYGLSGTVPDPALELSVDHDGNPATPAVLIASNDDYGNFPYCAAGYVCEPVPSELSSCNPISGQTTPPPNCEKEAGLLITLPPGVYTVKLYGIGNTTGIGMIGVIDKD